MIPKSSGDKIIIVPKRSCTWRFDYISGRFYSITIRVYESVHSISWPSIDVISGWPWANSGIIDDVFPVIWFRRKIAAIESIYLSAREGAIPEARFINQTREKSIGISKSLSSSIRAEEWSADGQWVRIGCQCRTIDSVRRIQISIYIELERGSASCFGDMSPYSRAYTCCRPYPASVGWS